MAEKATELNPTVAVVWNTLGVSHYRNGNYQAAAGALQKSLELSQDGTGFTTRFDGFFLAMAHWQLGDHELARDFYLKAERWMQEHKPDDQELQRFREEAIELLGKDALAEMNPGKLKRHSRPSYLNEWFTVHDITTVQINDLQPTTSFGIARL